MIMKKILSCSKNKKNPLNKHKQPKRNRTQVPSFPKPPNNDVIRAKSQVALQKKIDRLQVPKLRRYSDKIKPLAVKEKPKERRPPGRPKKKDKPAEEELEPQEFVVHYGPDGAISIKQVGNRATMCILSMYSCFLYNLSIDSIAFACHVKVEGGGGHCCFS